MFQTLIIGVDLGVTTGFGGSADTTTTATDELQVALLQMQLCAVLPVPAEHTSETQGSKDRAIFSNGDPLATLSMPEPWVRGAMLVRCNSLLRGHSAVRLSVIQALLALLQNNIVPFVPLRGSISASGDLCPLAYLAGAMEGNPDVRVWTGPPEARKLVASNVALCQLKLSPVVFGPKETLGILNGTAISASVATLAQHQADNLMVLSQILTAMGVEALLGRFESFDSFVGEVRPHMGQQEVAHNIQSFLKGSLLARKDDEGEFEVGHLRQDRYALRTASQWFGPYVEDLILARHQLATELNSTTDNPLFDSQTRKVYHAGNFQAVAVTSSTEKVRLAVQMMGKIIFAQSTELLDVHQNNGLPPNLAADEPSLSYTMKGVDINMAAYMSELAHLANPVSSHVQSAEMNNQSVNSLALISARYTHMSLDVLSLMLSAHLYSLCQALDLRAMNAKFLVAVEPVVVELTKGMFTALVSSKEKMDDAVASIWSAYEGYVSATTTKDSSDRFIAVASSIQPLLIDVLKDAHAASNALLLVTTWTKGVAEISKSFFINTRAAYLAQPDATPYIGVASKRMYTFVRRTLGVPFHRGLVDHPTLHLTSGDQPMRKNTGSQISIIYEALRDERLIEPVMECLKDTMENVAVVFASKL